ncbi:CD209 antigen-like protein C isoform X2 [Anabas testudineus]|uniref:CD209 antigen-like protein C isoform X2 n=1 Tax=Anabas testudineus TaxID=64144 RepID=UPI000E45E654|nr:CD209 antigen-like protein C isoform X2 [Anabas testudineus]
MESTSRQLDSGEAKTETPAASSQTCRLTAGVAVATAAIILVTGFISCLVLFFSWRAAPEVDQASETCDTELVEQLQQCQKELYDLKLMLYTMAEDTRCSLCPDGWMWWMGHCYFFSVGLEENLQWNESAEFCLLHNSSLAVIKDSAEMEFIQWVMRTFPHFPFLWVGLTDSQQEGQWLWWDGMDVQHYSPATVQWDADDRDCADLRGGGALFAADCEVYGPWVCKRES